MLQLPSAGPFAAPLLVAVVALANPCAAQVKTLQTMEGNFSAGWFGYAVDSMGDVNGDGVPDVIAGAPMQSNFVGRARVMSGATGSQLFSFTGSGASGAFGGAVAGVGDVNGDGTPDCAVGVFFASSISPCYCRVFSGLNGQMLFSIPGVDGEGFANAVGRIGDLNGDGTNDFLVGAPYSDAAAASGGRAFVYSGSNASILRTIDPLASGERVGSSVAGLGDVNLDGAVDFAVGASGASADAGATFPGVARVYSGANGSLLFSVAGTSEGEEFGSAVAGGGDVNGDGTPDLAVGAYLSNNNAGRAQLFSGVDGAPLKALKGGANEGFGFSLAIVGDVNGDGKADVLAGSPVGNKARLFSGATGTTLATIAGVPNDGTGTSVASAGDANGDGVPDLLVGSPYADLTPSEGFPGIVRVLDFDGAVASVKRKMYLQRDPAGPDADAFGSIEYQVSKTGQSIKLALGKLASGGGDAYHWFLETAPGSGLFEDQGALVLASDKTGSWTVTVPFAAGPFAELGVAFLTQLAGRVVEIRDGANQVVLWGVLPGAALANLKLKIPLATPQGGGVAASSGTLGLTFTASQGNAKLDVAAKKLAANVVYTVWLESAPGAGTFAQVGTLAKGKLVLDTKKGDPLPNGAATLAELSGLGVQIRDGATVVLEGTIP